MTRRVDEWMKPFFRNGRKAVVKNVLEKFLNTFHEVLDGGTGTTLVERGADVSNLFILENENFFSCGPTSPKADTIVYFFTLQVSKVSRSNNFPLRTRT